MQPNTEPTPVENKPPNPIYVLLFSLFGYPGLGHFWVGSKRLGTALALLFTLLTCGILYEMWVLVPPLLRLLTQGEPMDVSPDWTRIAFWVISSGIVWLASGLHSFALAKKLQP